MFKTECRRESNRVRNTIREALEPVAAPAPVFSGEIFFRLVLVTQIHENYGAHCWDGTGECPQYWKAKGGDEYHRNLGSASNVIHMGREGIARTLSAMRGEVEKSDECWQEYTINWELVPSNEETYGEREVREMLEWGWISPEQVEHYGPRCV